MARSEIFQKLSMSITFGVFVYSLISPMYIFFGRNSLSNIVYGRIPGIELNFEFFDRTAIAAFFILLILFFFFHTLSEKSMSKKILCAVSCVYACAYLALIVLVGTSGLVIFGFPVISVPLWAVLMSKFLILVPAAYFFMIWAEKGISGYIRWSSFFHGASLVLIGMIKVFEIIFPANLRMLFFDISTTVYLISLSMVTFFMYRKYYDRSEECVPSETDAF